MIKWIFFDVGNVILNDDPVMAYLYNCIYQAIRSGGINMTFEELLREREQLILSRRDGRHYATIGERFLGRHKWLEVERAAQKVLFPRWHRYCPLMPDIVKVIRRLHPEYPLGLLANQPVEAVGALEHYNLLHYFKIRGLSALVGLRKPDRRFFQWVLKEADCEPHEAIMIGDRIDNDVKPAKEIGMKTVWLKLGLELKGYEPKLPYERVYWESLQRASACQLTPRNAAEAPDFAASTFEELELGIQKVISTASRQK